MELPIGTIRHHLNLIAFQKERTEALEAATRKDNMTNANDSTNPYDHGNGVQNTAERSMTRRQAVGVLAAAGMMLAAAPAFAEDDTEETAEEEPVQGSEESANSFRYEDGMEIEHPKTDSGESGISLLSSNSSYSTWMSSYGTSYLGIVSGSSTTKVSISGVARVGIDVSKWNETIDWDAVAADGIEFAIIRCGYGSNWESQDDATFVTNAQGAKAAGLDIGVYLYSYATKTTGTDGSAASEADHALRMLNEAGLKPEDLDMPVFLDMEDDTQASLSSSKLGDIAETFCSAIEDAGYLAGIYANKNWWTNYLTDSYFDGVEYKWVARYPASTSITSTGVDGTDIWQFTSNGAVSGIDGDVDVNFDYLGADGYTQEEQNTTGLKLAWEAHIQTYGWKSGNSTAKTVQLGTTGNSKRLEAIKLSLAMADGSELPAGSITYRAYCQTYGWLDWVSDGALAGTTGESKRLEAIEIKLTGDMAEHYDVWYRAHCQTFGWLDWACNGESAGSMEYSKRMEALQICIVNKGEGAPGDTTDTFRQALVKYRAHGQTYGWQSYVYDGSTAGTTGSSKRLEAVNIALCSGLSYSGSITYRVHCQTYGWMDWVSDGAQAGTTGKKKRLEAIEIKLTGDMAEHYDIWYRAHCQTYGWLDWACNGESAGTSGLSKRMEALQIELVEKGGSAPGSTSDPYKSA